tara:strand:+ start:468 stop:938 length:471 start_codon:yes stop_codon:yes gene_type:complete
MKFTAFATALLMISTFSGANERAAVGNVLDTLHYSAASADWDAYFNVYSPDAIFIGTDASETWTIDEFKRYAKPAFLSGKGWTYTVSERHIYFSAGGNVAWFDEMLSNASLGVTRGTGVLENTAEGWKVKQYHLAIPIPNELAGEVANKIKAKETR